MQGAASACRPKIEMCRAGDEHELAAFHRRRTGKRCAVEYWRWKYFDNPAGPACVAAARAGDEIVGTLGFLPVRMRVDDREVVATQQVDVAILPEYRGGGIYFELADALMEEGAKRDVDFGFGFATQETRALSVDFLGFDLVGPIQRFARVIDYAHYAASLLGPRIAGLVRGVTAPARRASGRRPRLAAGVTAIDRFDEAFNPLAAGVAPGRILTIRDATYLNWRYADCPTVRYGRYAARTDTAVSGFVVCHTYEANGVVRGVVDELVCDDTEAADRLLRAAVSHLAAEGAVNAICWFPSWHPLAAKLRAHGFREREARNYLIVLANRNRGLDLAQLGEERNWYYTHGDSDYHVGTERASPAAGGALRAAGEKSVGRSVVSP